MELYLKTFKVKSSLNKLLRITQRTEITKLGTSTVTVRNVYKNKQIIEVSAVTLNRCNSKI